MAALNSGERGKKKGAIIPVESSWHHIVVNKLPLPPKVHWTVQLQDKIRTISVTLLGEEDIANKHQSNHYVAWKLHWKKKIKSYPASYFHLFAVGSWFGRSYLAVVTVRQYPVLLRRVEEQAQDMEANGMLLKACPFIWADENSALYLWVAKYHYLKYREQGEGIWHQRRGRDGDTVISAAIFL